MEEAYITRGFNNQKKALEAFVDHQQSRTYRAAITYESVALQCGDVLETTVNDLNNKRLAKRKYLMKVIEYIRFLERQRAAFRGNDGNDNLEPDQNKYIHNDIQNELIELMAKYVLEKKLESIRFRVNFL